MSRIAKNPVELPSGVQVSLDGRDLNVKGSNGTLSLVVSDLVEIKQEENQLSFSASKESKESKALAGTVRSLVSNMVIGVSQGFERKLVLEGVGYRAKASGNVISLTLGYSHPVDYTLPEGVTAETPTQTEIVVKCADKQQLGQVCSEIRALRAPEPYKGKGVRYHNERIRRKEAKKK